MTQTAILEPEDNNETAKDCIVEILKVTNKDLEHASMMAWDHEMYDLSKSISSINMSIAKLIQETK